MASSLESLWASVEAVPPVQTDILTKSSVGSYDLLRSLGEGEFAKVQSCRKTGDSRATVLAVKHISKSRLICSTNIKRTLRRVRRVGVEIRAMQVIDSPYVCKLFDVYHSPNYVHLVMENGGSDLYELIGDKSGMDSMSARTIALCLARALHASQSVGVVHRDLKPENVLCRMRRAAPGEACGDAGMIVEAVKLCDFGLCAIAPVVESPSSRHKAREGGGGVTTPPTSAGNAKKLSPSTVLVAPDGAEKGVARSWLLTDFSGSPGFVAPEIVTDDEYDGSKIDAFSLGCVLLELVLGHGSFDSIWMVPYSNESMSDRAAFRNNLNLALGQLRLLPEMASTPGGDDRRAAALAAADKAAASSGAPPGSDMSAMFACLGVGAQTASSDESPGSFRIPIGAGGETNELRSLVFGLLEIDPDKRLTLKGACGHPWFAPAAAFIDKA